MLPFPEFPERGRRVEIAPGAVHLPGWPTLDQQRQLVAACREWARGPVPMRHTRLATGGVISVQTMCLGWHWQPYRYSRTADDVNGERVAELPGWLADLGRQAVADAYGELASGDAFVFGGPSRFAYHAVPRLHPDSGDPATGLSSGRLNLTLRQTGLAPGEPGPG